MDGAYAGNASTILDEEDALRGLVALKGLKAYDGGSANTSGINTTDYPEGGFNQRILTTNKMVRDNQKNGFTSVDVVGPGFSESPTGNWYKANWDGRHIRIVSNAQAPIANVFEFNIDPIKFRQKFFDENGNYNGKLVFRNSFILNEKGTDNIVELDKSRTYASGTGESTQYTPKLDEIFTEETKEFTGHTLYPSAEVSSIVKNAEGEADSLTGYGDSRSEKVFYKDKDYDAYPFIVNLPEDLLLEKDLPVKFMAEEYTKMPSKVVTEQVQAKVNFDLMGQKSKIDGLGFIEKIAPLNKEYSYKITTNADGKWVYEKNEAYKPSGFAKIDKDGNIQGGENLQIAEDSKIVKVNQDLTNIDKDGASPRTSVEREVINYINHNGEPYSTNIENYYGKKAEERLLKRQFPVKEEVELPNGKRIIGWTSQPLEDRENGKTAAEQFYDLQDAKDENGKPKLIRDLSDWTEAEKEAYIFDEASPIDRNRTVYAVYGGPQIVLHSGVKGADGKEITVRVPITQSDVDSTPFKMYGLTQSEIDERIKTEVIKEIPKAPYTAKDASGADVRLLDFVKPDQSFVGWYLNPETQNLVAGKNNERISAIDKGETVDGKKLVKMTGWYSYIRENPDDAYLPNGFNLGISVKDFDKEGNLLSKGTTGAETLQSVDEFFEKGQDIHLYAVYRPYFNIKVKPQYNLFQAPRPEDPLHEWGTLVPGVPAEKQKQLQIGLMERTAVTGYDAPTVDATANYFPIGDKATLQTWDPKNDNVLEWTRPGFDLLGRRKSFVALVVAPDKEDTYENFAKPFSGVSWSQMGISTFLKIGGNSLDPNAPKNLYYDNLPDRDQYGKPLAKLQNFKFTSKGQDGEDVIDAFTSATSRAPIKNADNNKDINSEDIVGYDIVMTNLIQELPAPVFERVRYSDKKVVLEWEKTVNFDSIDKIEIYTFDYVDINKPVTLILTKKPDGRFSTDTGQPLEGLVKEYSRADGTKYYRLEITGLHLEELGGTDIGAKYFEGADVESQVGNTRIIAPKTSAEVHRMEQGVKTNPGEDVKIHFTVPEKDLDKVGPGTIYFAEKWDEAEKTWVKVGERVLTDDDLVNFKYEGNEYEIQLYEKNAPEGFTTVKDGDIIRIVSKETNKDEDKKDETGNIIEIGYSNPGYSAGRIPIIDKTLGITTGYEASNNPVNEQTERPMENYIVLDLKGPDGDIQGEDEKFRRFIDLTGDLSKIPDKQEVILEIGSKGPQGTEGNERQKFETKENLIRYFNEIPRLDTMPDMWVIARDYFGNEKIIKVTYTRTYQNMVTVKDYRTRRKTLNVTSNIGDVIVTATVYPEFEEEPLAEGSVLVEEPNEFVGLNLYEYANGDKPYRLKKGDRIRITSVGKSDGKQYTSNPFDIYVK